MTNSIGSFSSFVSETIDSLGFNIETVHRRQAAWELAASQLSKSLGNATYIHAGSTGEGVRLFTQSDLDIMAVNNHVICAEARVNNQRLFGQVTSLLVDRDIAPPGYTRLKYMRSPSGTGLLQKDNRIILNSILVDESGQKYISSDIYFEYCVAQNPRQLELPRQGPSAPSKGLGFSQDLVYCFACLCPSILNAWLQRRRSHEWPAPYVIRKISTLDGHVVPVGNKLSASGKHLEWRICYTLAELKLIHSFNDTQTKVYVLLKLLSKSVFSKFKDVLTSYLFKNVIMWVSELIPLPIFTTELLLDRLVQCYVFLSMCLRRNFLPNYMIPDRNLLSCKLTRARRASLQGLLTELIAEGGRMVLRCADFRRAMVKLYKSPEMVKEEGKVRDNKELFAIGQSNSQRRWHLKSTMPTTAGVVFPLQRHYTYRNSEGIMQAFAGNASTPGYPSEPQEQSNLDVDDGDIVDEEDKLILDTLTISAKECMNDNLL